MLSCNYNHRRKNVFRHYRLSLDDKNRMRLPAKFRAKIGDDFVLCQGTDGCLFVMSHNEFENFIQNRQCSSF